MSRISTHLKRRDDKPAIALVWGGYLAALLEWSLIDPEAYFRMLKLLPDVDQSAVYDVFGGFDESEQNGT